MMMMMMMMMTMMMTTVLYIVFLFYLLRDYILYTPFLPSPAECDVSPGSPTVITTVDPSTPAPSYGVTPLLLKEHFSRDR